MKKSNKKHIIEPQIFGILLESPNVLFLSVQCALSLEEAVLFAKMEFEKLNPLKVGMRNPLTDAKISLFAVKTITELMDVSISKKLLVKNLDKELGETIKILKKTVEAVPFPDLLWPDEKAKLENSPITKKEIQMKQKNDLMKQIIQKKDKKLFQKNKSTFSKAESEYLKAQLK